VKPCPIHSNPLVGEANGPDTSRATNTGQITS
jgi:hypothetical protein